MLELLSIDEPDFVNLEKFIPQISTISLKKNMNFRIAIFLFNIW